MFKHVQVNIKLYRRTCKETVRIVQESWDSFNILIVNWI